MKRPVFYVHAVSLRLAQRARDLGWNFCIALSLFGTKQFWINCPLRIVFIWIAWHDLPRIPLRFELSFNYRYLISNFQKDPCHDASEIWLVLGVVFLGVPKCHFPDFNHRPFNGPFQRDRFPPWRGARKLPISANGAFPSLMGRFPTLMGRFPECLNVPFPHLEIPWETAH